MNMKENKEAGISQNDSKKAERPERKKRTSVKENKKEKTSKLKIIPLGTPSNQMVVPICSKEESSK